MDLSIVVSLHEVDNFLFFVGRGSLHEAGVPNVDLDIEVNVWLSTTESTVTLPPCRLFASARVSPSSSQLLRVISLVVFRSC